LQDSASFKLSGGVVRRLDHFHAFDVVALE
jgi:hypothetical protein